MTTIVDTAIVTTLPDEDLITSTRTSFDVDNKTSQQRRLPVANVVPILIDANNDGGCEPFLQQENLIVIPDDDDDDDDTKQKQAVSETNRQLDTDDTTSVTADTSSNSAPPLLVQDGVTTVTSEVPPVSSVAQNDDERKLLYIQPATRRLNISEKQIRNVRSNDEAIIVEWFEHNNKASQQHRSNDSSSCVPTITAVGGKESSSSSSSTILTYHGGTTVRTSLTPSLIRDSSSNSTGSSAIIFRGPPSTSISTTATSTFLVVTGPTGSGKTTLLQSTLRDLLKQLSSTSPPRHPNDGYCIRGNFDVLQHPDPYRTYTMALSDFVNQVLERAQQRQLPSSLTATDSSIHATIQSLREAIVNACGDEIHVLVQMIPSLREIVHCCGSESTTIAAVVASRSDDVNMDGITDTPNHPNTSSNNSPPNADAIQRFVFVFQKFLRAICSVVQPIVFVLEDLQYADDCSIDVLCIMLSDLHSIPGLFVAGTYNGTDLDNEDNEEQQDYIVREDWLQSNLTTTTSNNKRSYLVENLRKMERISSCTGSHSEVRSIRVQTIAIQNFDRDQVQYVLCQTLQQCAHFDLQIDDDFCSLVMERTGGNLFCMVEFLHWLEDHQLVTTNCPPNCNNTFTYWRWDSAEIRRVVKEQIEKANDQQFYLSNKVEKIPLDVIEVLKVGACLGSGRMDETLIEYALDYPIQALLSEAVDMGILIILYDGKEGRQSAFVHENIHKMVYSLIPENSLELFHLEIGRRLWRRLDRDELDRNIFVVLSQILIGRRLISRLIERYKIAALCLHAGRKAVKSSSFRISLVYLKFGIEMLGDRGWRDEYDLALMLYNATAELEACNANYEGMELLVPEILKNGRSVDDKIQARTTQVYALCVCDRQQEGLDLGIQLMADLGYAFPVKFCLWTLRNEIMKVLSLLKGKSNDYLKRLPVVDDAKNPKVLAAMQVLNLMFLHAILARPMLATYVSLKMMHLTLTNGLCFISPQAFATFGMICVKVFPKPDAALRYGELGLELIDMFQVREYLPRVYASYYGCIFQWRHPLRDSLDHLRHAQRVGMQTGDFEFACLCANLWGYIAMDTDIPLDEIERHWTTCQITMKSRRQKSILRMSVTCLQFIQYYQGKDVDLEESEMLYQHSIENKLSSTRSGILWNRAKSAYFFNDLSYADELTYSVNFSNHLHCLPPTCELVQLTFLNGMIAFAMVPQTRRGHSSRPRRTRKQYISEGRQMLRFIKKYVLWAPMNYADKQLLLEAELAAVEGRQDIAMKQYVCAIALSKVSRNKFVQGLANERAGRYCLSELKQPETAMVYFNEALLVYGEWKAHRKVEHLVAEMKTMFDSGTTCHELVH